MYTRVVLIFNVLISVRTPSTYFPFIPRNNKRPHLFKSEVGNTCRIAVEEGIMWVQLPNFSFLFRTTFHRRLSRPQSAIVINRVNMSVIMTSNLRSDRNIYLIGSEISLNYRMRTSIYPASRRESLRSGCLGEVNMKLTKHEERALLRVNEDEKKTS